METEKRSTAKGKAIKKVISHEETNFFIRIVFCLFFYLLAAGQAHGQVVPSGGIVYVAPNGTGDGNSWGNAASIENAIATAPANTQIWLQQGVYAVTQTLEVTAGNLHIYGGFEGTETTLNERDWQNNTTILDGQTTVKIMTVFSNNSILDGLTFIHGFVTGTTATTNDGGGALRLRGDNTLIINCTFRDNVSEAERGGGAIFMWHGRGHTIDNCVFERNSNVNSSGNGGGAIHNWDNDVTIRNTRFRNNSSTTGGGAIYTWSSPLLIEDCIFENNESVGAGGAVHTRSILSLSNAEFTGNRSGNNGGAVYNGEEMTLQHTIFIDNAAEGNGGAIHNGLSSAVAITNAVFNNNQSNNGGAIYNDDELSLSNSLFNNNVARIIGGAIYNNEELYVTNSTFVSNTNTAIVHPYRESSAYDTFRTHIFNSIFYNNTAGSINGVSLWADVDRSRNSQDQSEKDFRRNIFQENTNGIGNLIGVDPLFQDFSSGDFSLQDNSPAVEYGRNSLYTAVKGNGPALDIDLAINPRLFDTHVDAGAYELQMPSTLTPPGCTTLSTPSDGATDVVITSAITWNVVADAYGYYISIGTSSGGTDIENRLDVGNSTTYTPTGDLPENTTIYVTVIPYNTAGDATGCQEESFTTEILPTVPGCATNITPADNATDTPLDANISWNAVSGADGYRIFVGTTPGGTDITNNLNVTATSFNPPADFPENTALYVRVVPYNGVGDATGCSEISFTTIARPDPPQANDQQFCPPATVADLVVTGTDIRWYDQATGGTALSGMTTLTTGTYYATQTVGGMESDRREVEVTVEPPAAPQFVGDVTGCGNVTVADLEDEFPGLRWYDQETGGTALSSTEAVSTGTYYASRVSGACESDCTAVQVIIHVTPVPVVPDQSFTPGSTFAELDVTGNNLQWYTNPTGGSPFDPTTVISNGTYYVSQTLNSCESDRVIVEITITALPPGCVTNITPTNNATGVARDANITWDAVNGATGYRVSIGTIPGGADIANNVNVTGTSYNPPADFPENRTIYISVVSYNAAGEATDCPEISFTTIARPAPPQADDQQLCPPATVADLVAVGADIRWYDQAVGGAALSTTTVLSTGTYYATQTVAGMESNRHAIAVTVQPLVAPQFVGDIIGCGNLTVADLENVGTGLRWYGQATGGTALSPTTVLSTGTYYASRVSGACESDRTAVQVVISVTPVPDVPNQRFVGGSTFADLNVIGQNLRWYTEPSGSISFDAQTVISDGTYYVSQTIDGCESDRVIVQINIALVPNCATNINPANNATGVSLDANIGWDAVTGADGYYINIGTIPGGTDIADNVDVIGTSYNPLDDFPENTTIYVQVVPYNATGSATDCVEISFKTETVQTRPLCSMITSPSDGTQDVALRPEIIWEASSGATGYRLTISTTPMGGEIMDAVDVGNETNYTLTADLAENTVYYIRVVPYNAVGDAADCEDVQFRTRLREVPSITFQDRTFEYDGTVHRLTIEEDLPIGLQVSYSSNNNIRDVGEERVTATVSGEGYATLILSARLRIIPKSIHIVALSQSKEYGDDDPTLLYTLTPNLSEGDNVTGTLVRTEGEQVGIYAIMRGTLSLGENYQLHFAEGELHILPAPLIISASDTVKMYDGIPFLGGIALQFSGFKFDENESNLSGGPIFTGDSQGAVAVGQYSIILSGYTANNYNITYQQATLHIRPRTFFVPNVITPNGDGTNETFYVKGLNMLFWVKLNIYNRSGQMLYNSEDYQDDFRGELLLDGTYLYEMEYKETPTAKIKKHKGYLTIIRRIASSYY